VVGSDGIDNSILSSQLILLFFGEIFPNSWHQKMKKTWITAILKKDKNNSQWIGKKSMEVLSRFFHKNSRFFQTANKPEPASEFEIFQKGGSGGSLKFPKNQNQGCEQNLIPANWWCLVPIYPPSSVNVSRLPGNRGLPFIELTVCR
jgi:hypothetical protein